MDVWIVALHVKTYCNVSTFSMLSSIYVVASLIAIVMLNNLIAFKEADGIHVSTLDSPMAYLSKKAHII